MISDHYMHDHKFKKDLKESFAKKDMDARNINLHYDQKFKTDKFIQCRHFFDNYITKYGPSPYIYTRFSLLNSVGNKMLSYAGISTNQEYAKKMVDVFDAYVSENVKNENHLSEAEKDEKLKLEATTREKVINEIKKSMPILTSSKEYTKSEYIKKVDELINQWHIQSEQKKWGLQIKKALTQINISPESIHSIEEKFINAKKQNKEIEKKFQSQKKITEFSLLSNKLKKIRDIYLDMIDKKIPGEVRRHIEEILNKFKVETFIDRSKIFFYSENTITGQKQKLSEDDVVLALQPNDKRIRSMSP